MEFDRILQKGLRAEKTETAGPENSAVGRGSGTLNVYATPSMIALMEGAAVRAVDPLLPEGWSTVGTALDVKHLSATPPGLSVRAAAELTAVEGRRLFFKVEAFDDADKIGEGTHTRFIVENGRFMQKAEGKKTR